MSKIMVRYKVKPERAEENERLVRAVYEELARSAPAGFHYATFCLPDGVSFVHIASSEADGSNPLGDVKAFAEFQNDVRERCAEPPVTSRAARGRLVSLLAMNPVVHLELHTDDLPQARAHLRAAMRLAGRAGADEGGSVPRARPGRAASAAASSSAAPRAACGCPTCEVGEIDAATARARELGASVLLEPREGPAGWRTVVSTPAGGEIAFWQPKGHTL